MFLPGTGGTLYLNVGSRADYRNLANSDTDESYIIEDQGPSSSGVGRRIRVIAFGRSNVIDNVTGLVGDFSSGNDSVIFRGTTPITVNLDMGDGEDVVVWDGSGYATITGGNEDGSSDTNSLGDYIEIQGSGSATVNGNNGDDYIIHAVESGLAAGSVTVYGGSGRDRILGGSGSDVIDAGDGDDEVDGPASRIDGGNDNDLISFYLEDQSGGATLSGGIGRDVVNIIGTASSDALTVTNNGAGVRVDANGALINAATVETLLLDGRGGADTFVIDNLGTVSGLSSFNINFGQTVTQQGVISRTEVIGDTTVTIEEPNLVASPDRAADQLVVRGGSGADLFFVNAAGPDPAAGVYQSISVVRGGSAGYSVNVVNSVRGELDSLEIQGLGGNDTLDATGLGVSSSGTGSTIEAIDRVALTLVGGSGDDILLGSPFDDALDGGEGSDTYTGGLGLDTFTDASTSASDVDTLIETQDFDLFISDGLFVTGTILGDGEVQVVTSQNGDETTQEIQRITHSGAGRNLYPEL